MATATACEAAGVNIERKASLPSEHDWPERLLTWIDDTYGAIDAVEQLAGMSLNGVWRVRFVDGSVIVKAGPAANETHFYERVAPSLRASGIPIPDLYHSLHEPDRHWLVIEDIPTSLTKSGAGAWQPDQRIVAILARLHEATRANPPDLPERDNYAWQPASTASALACLQPDDAADLAPILERLQRERTSFDERWCWISGDPNPRNWGLRADGTPVLFDWELFGPGAPATDLAIIIPGLGTPANYARVAAAYLAAAVVPLPWDTNHLARQVAVAKVATVVQLLDGYASGTANVSDELVSWLAGAVPAWIRSLHNTDYSGRS